MSDDRQDITGISSLDPSVALKAQQIQKMPPQQAIQFLLSNGVDSRMASMVMKNMMLKKSASSQAPQQKPGQPPPTTVAQDIDNHINQVAQQHASSQGLAGLPMSGNLFKGDTEGMAAGGIVHFDDGGYTSGPPLGAPSEISPLDTGAMQQYTISQNMANQQMQQQAQQAAQAQQQYSQAGINMAKGGLASIKHFDQGGATAPEDLIDPASGYPLGAFQTTIPANQAQSQAGIASALNNVGDALFDPYHGQAVQGVAPPAVRAAQAMGNGPAQGQMPPQQGPPQPPQGPPQPPKPPMGPQGNGAAPQGAPGPAQGGGGINMRANTSANGLGPLNAMGARDQAQIDQFNPQNPNNSFAAILARNTQVAETQGIGAAAQAHLKDLEDQKAQLQTLAAQGKYQALAQAGFAMASAATSNPHGGFLGALAVGGATGAKEYGQTLAQYHVAMANVQNQQYQVGQAQEALKYDISKTSQKEYQDNQDKYIKAVTAMDDTQYKAAALVYGKENAQIMAAATRSLRDTPDQEAYRELSKYQPGSPQYQQALQRYQDFRGAGSQVQAAQLRADASQANNAASNQAKIQEAQVRLRGTPNYQMAMQMSQSSNPQIAAKGQAEMQRLEQSVQSGAPQAGGLPPGWSVTPR